MRQEAASIPFLESGRMSRPWHPLFFGPQSSTVLLVKTEFLLAAQLIIDSEFVQKRVIETFDPPMLRREGGGNPPVCQQQSPYKVSNTIPVLGMRNLRLREVNKPAWSRPADPQFWSWSV